MTHEVTVEPIGETVKVEEGQTILDACLRAGIWLPHACGHGLCSTCKVQVVDGFVDHNDASSFALMDMERREGKTLACTATLRTDAVIEAEIEDDPDALHLPVEDHVGTVTRIEDLTPRIKGFWVELDEPMEFQAGQYANFHIPGLDEPRPFSMSSSPSNPKELEFCIQLVEGGPGTTYLHEEMKEGDRLELSGPYGHFFVRKSADKPIIFLAGGSGLSAIKSMVLDLHEDDEWDKPILLIHGVRDVDNMFFNDKFEELQAEWDLLDYVTVLSHCSDEQSWGGELGYVHDALGRRFEGRFKGQTAYLCGPPPMIDACLTTLMQGRLFEKDIFTEKFLTNENADDSRSKIFKKF